MVGVSLYGRKNINNFYLTGRTGFGHSDTEVERDILVNPNVFEYSKAKHKDSSFSAYLETGYDLKNSKEDMIVTPYAALGTDFVTRGKFSEKNKFGMTADKKSYNMPFGTIGTRVSKNFGKVDVSGYLSYTHGFNKKHLTFDAAYNFTLDKKDEIKGIDYSRNKINTGVGINTEIKDV